MTAKILYPTAETKPEPVKRYVNIWQNRNSNCGKGIVAVEHMTLEKAEHEPSEGNYTLLARVEVELK